MDILNETSRPDSAGGKQGREHWLEVMTGIWGWEIGLSEIISLKVNIEKKKDWKHAEPQNSWNSNLYKTQI